MRGGGAIVVAAIIVAVSCTVDRRTPGLACGPNDTCANGRICVQGYCVFSGGCPAQCSSCDTSANPPTCSITDPMGNTSCPSGFDCTIHCDSSKPCGNVDCSMAAACTVQCSAQGACGNVTCGNGPCDVTCSGTNACGNVTCSSSCKCDVACSPGDCGILSCPMQRGGGGGNFCTANGSDNQPCVSALPRCGSC